MPIRIAPVTVPPICFLFDANSAGEYFKTSREQQGPMLAANDVSPGLRGSVRLRRRIANEMLTGRSEMSMASSNTNIGVSRRSCSHETVEASFRDLCLQFTRV